MKDYEKEKNTLKKRIASRNTSNVLFDKTSLKHALILVTFAIVLYWGLRHSDQPLSILKGLISLISPFITGLCIAFVVNILMRWLEKIWSRIWKKRKSKWFEKLKRPVCLVLSALILIGVVCALLFMILPEFISTIKTFIDSIPQYIKRIEGWWGTLNSIAERFGMVIPELKFNTDEVMGYVNSILRNNDSMIFNTTISFTTSIVSGLFNLIVSVVFSIYVLAQKEKLGRQFKKTLYAYFKEKKVNKFLELVSLTDRTFTSFVAGQFTEAVIIGVLCFIGMMIFRIPYAPIVSLLVGVTALIPVLGAFIGTALGAFLILLVSPIKALFFVLFIVVLQQLEGNFIYPKVVGKSVGLPGMWVLVAVSIGGGLDGITGMLFSVPICALAYTLLKRSVASRLKKKAEAEDTESEAEEAVDAKTEPEQEAGTKEENKKEDN